MIAPILPAIAPPTASPSSSHSEPETQWLHSLSQAPAGLSLSEMLVAHPDLARRTAQRWLAQQVQTGHLHAIGRGRATRYVTVGQTTEAAVEAAEAFPPFLTLSQDSRDILAYIDQPLLARKPVGYQDDFLQAYRPNETAYLSAPLRKQLHRMGNTGQIQAMAGTYSRSILNRLLIDLSWASSQLEGNTYSRLDTRALIEQGRAATGKAAIETQMILNHKAAIELMVENVADMGFNRFTVLNLHSALSENLLPNPADEGRIRQHAVSIGKSVYRPLAGPAQLDAQFNLLLAKADAIADPFEQSFFAMVHLPYLQPFADVNKRTSRLAANLPLVKANLCPLTFLDVPESAYSRAMLGVYEMCRVELLRDLYVWAYERSTQEYLAITQTLAEPDALRQAFGSVVKHAVGHVVKHLDEDPLRAIDRIVGEQVPTADQAAVRALTIEELRRLHEGVLARYGLRPSEFLLWQARQAEGR